MKDDSSQLKMMKLYQIKSHVGSGFFFYYCTYGLRYWESLQFVVQKATNQHFSPSVTKYSAGDLLNYLHLFKFSCYQTNKLDIVTPSLIIYYLFSLYIKIS